MYTYLYLLKTTGVIEPTSEHLYVEWSKAKYLYSQYNSFKGNKCSFVGLRRPSQFTSRNSKSSLTTRWSEMSSNAVLLMKFNKNIIDYCQGIFKSNTTTVLLGHIVIYTPCILIYLFLSALQWCWMLSSDWSEVFSEEIAYFRAFTVWHRRGAFKMESFALFGTFKWQAAFKIVPY